MRRALACSKSLSNWRATAVCLPLWRFSAPETTVRWTRRWITGTFRLDHFHQRECRARGGEARRQCAEICEMLAGRRCSARRRWDRPRQPQRNDAGFFVDYQAKTHSGARWRMSWESGSEIRPCFCRAATARIRICRGFCGIGADVTEAIAYRTVTPVNLDRDNDRGYRSRRSGRYLYFSAPPRWNTLSALWAIRCFSLCSAAWPLPRSARSPQMR